jgi:glutaredoxin-related protein
MTEKYNWYTVPMIMIGEEFIGGFDQLQALHSNNQLATKIHS